jgi:lauroyl/myristoyl acyltransferase
VKRLVAKGLIATLPSILPPERVYRVAERISGLFLRGKERRLRADVERLFPDRDRAWVDDVVHRQRTARTWSALDKSMFPKLGGDRLVEMVEPASLAESRALVDAALADGNGGIIYSLHYGRPMVSPFAMAHLGYPYMGIRAGTNTNELDAKAVGHAKEVGIELLEASELSAGVQVLRALKRNRLFWVLVDGGRTRPTKVDFLGRQLPVAIGFAQLAKRTGAALLAGVTYSDAPLRFRIAGERVRLPDGNLSNEEMAALLVKPLERMVAEDVGQWYGINRMFRGQGREEGSEPGS